MKSTAQFFKVAMAVLALAVMSTKAEVSTAGSYQKGMFLGQAGIGLGFYGSVYGNASLPPLSVLVEYGIHDLVSIGGGIGIEGSSYDYTVGYTWKYTYTYIPLMFRGVFHPFNLPSLIGKIPKRDKWDAYGGITLGWVIVSYSVTPPQGYPGSSYYTTEGSYFLPGLLLGTRYYFTKKFGVYAEEGSGFGWFNIGGVYNFQI